MENQCLFAVYQGLIYKYIYIYIISNIITKFSIILLTDKKDYSRLKYKVKQTNKKLY